VPSETWQQELASMTEFLDSFGMRLPVKLRTELEHTHELFSAQEKA
jgi:GTP-dependent phosphoenolpyruvate carboxykinase